MLVATLLFFIGFFILYCVYKFNKLIKTNNNKKMSEEASRILLENAENTYDVEYPMDDRTHCTGLALIKNVNTGKYNLIPQIKVCDIGLY